MSDQEKCIRVDYERDFGSQGEGHWAATVRIGACEFRGSVAVFRATAETPGAAQHAAFQEANAWLAKQSLEIAKAMEHVDPGARCNPDGACAETRKWSEQAQVSFNERLVWGLMLDKEARKIARDEVGRLLDLGVIKRGRRGWLR